MSKNASNIDEAAAIKDMADKWTKEDFAKADRILAHRVLAQKMENQKKLKEQKQQAMPKAEKMQNAKEQSSKQSKEKAQNERKSNETPKQTSFLQAIKNTFASASTDDKTEKAGDKKQEEDREELDDWEGVYKLPHGLVTHPVQKD